MQLHSMRLVTIVAEQTMFEHIKDLINNMAVSGYTWRHVQGEGEHGLNTNVQIEVIASPPIAEDILNALQTDFFTHKPIIGYMADVKVIQHRKFF